MPGPANAALIAEMFDRYAAALEFYAAQRTAAAPDCVQEAFLELARQAVPPVDTAAWLFRVVRNRSLNAARAERRARIMKIRPRTGRPQAVARQAPRMRRPYPTCCACSANDSGRSYSCVFGDSCLGKRSATLWAVLAALSTGVTSKHWKNCGIIWSP